MAGGKRDPVIDMLKGLCILLVVYGHLPRVGYLGDVLERVVQFIYTFHLPIFVFISGFFFAKRTGTFNELKKIVDHILKPYFVVGLVMVPLYMLSGKGLGSFWSNVVGLFTGHAGGALWYLYSLAWLEGLALAGVRVARKWQGKWQNIILVTWFVLAGCLLLNLNGGEYVRLFPVWLYSYFLVGYLVGTIRETIFGCGWAIFIASAAVCLLDVKRDTWGSYFWVLPLISSLVWALGKLEGTRIGIVLAYLGGHSLAILIFHPFLNAVLNPACGSLIAIEGSGIAVALISLTLNVSICMGMEWVIRKLRLSPFVF